MDQNFNNGNLNNPNFNPNTGAPYNPQMPPQQEQKGMSIASMVLGLVGIVAWCLPLVGYPVTIVGLILGIKGKDKGGRGMAIAGIILCSIFLAVTLVNSILGVILGSAIGNMIPQ